jgi:hypothetical protein
VDKLKFEYKREIIDEEGDGEFVSKPQDKKTLKRSRRSLESEDFDGRKKMALRAMADSSDATNPESAVAEPSRRGDSKYFRFLSSFSLSINMHASV